MIYSDFNGLRLSRLGFGTMRLPTDAKGAIDEKQVEDMIRYALDNGVNYFDTAYPYHAGMSESVVGRILNGYPTEKWHLATKYPGHQIASHYDPKAIFEDQLQKCGVESFDFYLLHNVYEKSMLTYTDPKWGIIDYFVEQQRLGRIKYLGFSSHGSIDCLRAFLDAHGEKMSFCLMQLNYLDWTLQDAKAKYELLTERGVPVWVMEPLRGGRLAALSPEQEARLKALRPNETAAAWAFRFLQSLDNVKVVLSGMSTLEQTKENIAIFSEDKKLNDLEKKTLMEVAEDMKNGIPCTECRYCCDGCPIGLDIPMLLNIYNDIRFAPAVNTGMRIEALPPEKRPDACINCGQCTKACPQNIDIPTELSGMVKALEAIPKWADICRQRELEQKANR